MTLPGQSDSGPGSKLTDELALAAAERREETAASAFRRLHTHAVNGYEPGDCHCVSCDVIVADLADYLGLVPPSEGVFSPAALVREAAAARRWYR